MNFRGLSSRPEAYAMARYMVKVPKSWCSTSRTYYVYLGKVRTDRAPYGIPAVHACFSAVSLSPIFIRHLSGNPALAGLGPTSQQ